MKVNVFLFFQVVIKFWNKHFNNEHFKNFEIAWILKNITQALNFMDAEKPIRIRRYQNSQSTSNSQAEVLNSRVVKVITETLL